LGSTPQAAGKCPRVKSIHWILFTYYKPLKWGYSTNDKKVAGTLAIYSQNYLFLKHILKLEKQNQQIIDQNQEIIEQNKHNTEQNKQIIDLLIEIKNKL